MSTIACQKNYSIVIAGPCGSLTSTDWQTNPGNCRLRIKNYNPADFAGACGGCLVSGLPDWNGEFAQFCNLAPSEKYAPAAGKSIGGKAMAPNPCVSSNFGILAGHWVFQVSCDNGGGGIVVWSGPGPLSTSVPIGTYTLTFGCLAGPATLDIEAYTL